MKRNWDSILFWLFMAGLNAYYVFYGPMNWFKPVNLLATISCVSSFEEAKRKAFKKSDLNGAE